MTKKTATILIAILFVLTIIIGFRIISGEDKWICQDGQWVKHGQPDTPKPDTPCPK